MRIAKPDNFTTIATRRRSWWRGGGFNVVRSTSAGPQVIAWFFQEKDADLFVSWFDNRIAA